MSAATTPWVKMDRLRSQQIYVNLLNNAIKFSEPGSTVSWRIVDQVLDDHRMHMVCTVEDHGCGMSEAFQKQVFQPFAQERLHGVTPQQGTGLGLSIVKNLVEQMGGTITFTSRLGEGTTFVMALDREISFAPKPQQCAPVDRLGTLPEGLHVLLCEDHPLNAQIAYKMLSRKGVVCDVAENGQVGVDRFAASAIGGYDAVLMDVRMPVMDGLAATRAIRALPRADAAGVPIIAMTANAYDEDVRACLEAGMNAHVAKPVEPALLYVTLARCLKCR